MPYDSHWSEKYLQEAKVIRSVLAENILDMQHIGSTAMKGISSKPIIDMAVLFAPQDVNNECIESLAKIGYTYYPESSSVERMFFRKGEPVEYHLSVAAQGKTSYWERQIAFRDFLNSHPVFAQEYETLKKELIEVDPTGRQTYSDGKTSFVERIIKMAQPHKT